LKDRVIVRRDVRSIPYIEAANESDLYFTQGYVTASDRLWQMDLLRRTASGELAEILGRPVLEQDKLYRTYGFAAISQSLLDTLAAPVRAQFEAYSNGVNAFINSCDANALPLEFRTLQYKPKPWKPADSLLIGKLMAAALSTSWQMDMMRASRNDLPRELREVLNTKTSPLDVPIVGKDPASKATRINRKSSTAFVSSDRQLHDAGEVMSSIAEVSQDSLRRVGLFASELAASNNWVVSGKRTASGKPLLANDPHLDPSVPSIWYMTHLSMQRLRVAGVTFPGVPGIVIGHNDRISWGMTNLGADVQDVYAETFDKQNTRLYLTPGGWQPCEVRSESIKIRKGSNDPSTETINFDVTSTSHGPIIFEKDSVRYSLRWVAINTLASELEAFYGVNRARNWKDFCEALRDFPGPSQNFIYADVEGHIGYYGAGTIPIRKTGDGSLPYDGSKDSGEWTGFIPFDELPHLYDPPSGVIVTANNRVVGLDYTHHLTSDWAPPYRARRILDLLKEKSKLTAEDFRKIQGDAYSLSGVIFAQNFLKAVRSNTQIASNPSLGETIRLLESWDGNVKADSRAVVLLAEIRTIFRRRILTDAIGQIRANQSSNDIAGTFIDFLITEQPKEWLPKEFASYNELLIACEKDARESLARRFGADPLEWKWNRIAIGRFPHPLSAIPTTGTKFTVPPLALNGSNGTFPTVNVGVSVSMRVIADPGDWDKTQQGIAMGQSGDPTSPYWTDQLDDWKAVTTQIFPFTKTAVANAQKKIVELVPLKQ
jgi:penicillin amidase